MKVRIEIIYLAMRVGVGTTHHSAFILKDLQNKQKYYLMITLLIRWIYRRNDKITRFRQQHDRT